MKIMTAYTFPETPAGKRTVHTNVWGNTNGYVSGRRFWEFGTDRLMADCWEAGSSLKDASFYRLPRDKED